MCLKFLLECSLFLSLFPIFLGEGVATSNQLCLQILQIIFQLFLGILFGSKSFFTCLQLILDLVLFLFLLFKPILKFLILLLTIWREISCCRHVGWRYILRGRITIFLSYFSVFRWLFKRFVFLSFFRYVVTSLFIKASWPRRSSLVALYGCF